MSSNKYLQHSTISQPACSDSLRCNAAGCAEIAAAALSQVLETNDKQHLSISILLNDNQQLQDKLLAREAELHVANQETLAALTACKAAEQSLTASQVFFSDCANECAAYHPGQVCSMYWHTVPCSYSADHLKVPILTGFIWLVWLTESVLHTMK